MTLRISTSSERNGLLRTMPCAVRAQDLSDRFNNDNNAPPEIILPKEPRPFPEEPKNSDSFSPVICTGGHAAVAAALSAPRDSNRRVRYS